MVTFQNFIFVLCLVSHFIFDVEANCASDLIAMGMDQVEAKLIDCAPKDVNLCQNITLQYTGNDEAVKERFRRGWGSYMYVGVGKKTSQIMTYTRYSQPVQQFSSCFSRYTYFE